MIEASEPNVPTAMRVERSKVWPGCLLGSIAHAAFMCRAPLLANEQSWSKITYSVHDTGGCRGTIVFAAETDVFVGVASSFAHWPPLLSLPAEEVRLACAENVQEHFRGLPKHLNVLRDEALQYSLESVHGVAVPVVTAAFWASHEDGFVSSAASWDSVIDAGGYIFEKQFMLAHDALPHWQLDMAFDDDAMKLITSLFERRAAASIEGQLRLSTAELALLQRMASSDEALDVALEALSEIGFSTF